MGLDEDNEREAAAEARLQAIRAISKRCAALVRAGGPPIDHAELLYDERGLPKGTWVYDDPDDTAR